MLHLQIKRAIITSAGFKRMESLRESFEGLKILTLTNLYIHDTHFTLLFCHNSLLCLVYLLFLFDCDYNHTIYVGPNFC